MSERVKYITSESLLSTCGTEIKEMNGICKGLEMTPQPNGEELLL